MTRLEKILEINKYRNQSGASLRICSELCYLDNLSELNGGKYDALIEAAADYLLKSVKRDAAITPSAMAEAEGMLTPLRDAAKSLTEIFISHAHIDMNWMWGYNETVSITVNTFRTVLELMREYPEFTFAQSQASTYEIIEKYRPDMLDEIRRRIKEGRWEVTAAEWVEPDKNMPDGESLARQLLQTKKYLKPLLGLSDNDFDLDFVPDTFGHNINVPEILADAGVKYLYHCRGEDGPCVYNYRSRSGKQVLTYREFRWYNGEMSPELFELVPKFCKQEGLDKYLCVYGVGDHGGGPSRRDIERILDYASWPFTPKMVFGRFRDFFEYIENTGREYPVIDSELNFLFTGCYTTQTRVKMANRIAELRMNEAEALSAGAKILTGRDTVCPRTDEAWRNILFGHFHDILPGSGTVETREYALGKFQETMATVTSTAERAMYAVAEQIDTSKIAFDNASDSKSEGGGVGFGVNQPYGFRMPSAERGRGSVRAFHVFNPTVYERREFTEIRVWDYNCDVGRCEFVDENGNLLESELVDRAEHYWGHSYLAFNVRVDIPAFGYATVILRQKTISGYVNPTVVTYEHTDSNMEDTPIVLENKYIKAVFNRSTLELIRLEDKESGEILISEPSCFFRLIEENPVYGMTAWRVGLQRKAVNLNRENSARLTSYRVLGSYSALEYDIKFGRSALHAVVKLKKDGRMLEFTVTADWKEEPIRGEMIPQLNFAVPVSYKTNGKTLCAIPYGELERNNLNHDIPSIGYIGICGESKHIVGLVSDTKYGFRNYCSLGALTLIRSSYDPDPNPELGVHNIRIGVTASAKCDIAEIADGTFHPLPYISAGKSHSGNLPMSGSFAKVNGNVRVACIKPSEDGKGITVRLINVGENAENAEILLAKPIDAAFIADTHEKRLEKLSVDNGKAVIAVPKYSVVTVIVS